MKLNTTNENYCATIVKVNSTVKLDGLDNLVGVPIYGFQALCKKDIEIGSLGVLFTAETQLSEDFCRENNLFTDPELNKNKIKGYISEKRRVRAIKLKGHVSSALLLDVSSLSYLGIDVSQLKEGDTFNEIDGIEICKKYQLAQRSARNKKPQKEKKKYINKLFPEHIDTSFWDRNVHRIDDNEYLYVSQKLHGCVHYDSVVQTLEFGPKKIGEIVDNKIKCKILGRDLLNNEDVYSDIDAFYFKENDGDWYEIELENGIKLTITGNNPVWLPEFQCYRKVEDLIGNEEIQLLQ